MSAHFRSFPADFLSFPADFRSFSGRQLAKSCQINISAHFCFPRSKSETSKTTAQSPQSDQIQKWKTQEWGLLFLLFVGTHNMAVGQNQWYHSGVGAPPILVYFHGDWDVHWGYGILAHGHIQPFKRAKPKKTTPPSRSARV